MAYERGKKVQYVPTSAKKHIQTTACKGHNELLFPSWKPPTEWIACNDANFYTWHNPENDHHFYGLDAELRQRLARSAGYCPHMRCQLESAPGAGGPGNACPAGLCYTMLEDGAPTFGTCCYASDGTFNSVYPGVILTQCPLLGHPFDGEVETLSDYLKMIVQEGVETVIQVEEQSVMHWWYRGWEDFEVPPEDQWGTVITLAMQTQLVDIIVSIRESRDNLVEIPIQFTFVRQLVQRASETSKEQQCPLAASSPVLHVVPDDHLTDGGQQSLAVALSFAIILILSLLTFRRQIGAAANHFLCFCSLALILYIIFAL